MSQVIELWAPITVSAVIAVALAVLGAWFTKLDSWYRNLRKPTWQPPDWLFGPAWTVIYALTATSGTLAWDAADTGGERRLVLILFGINIVLNAGWSWFFFARKRPDWALVEVACLWLSIVAMVVGIWPLSQTAALLLLPYLAWVSFASFLNATIVRLNAPFRA
jgi:tryptophan-rich sensory protein